MFHDAVVVLIPLDSEDFVINDYWFVRQKFPCTISSKFESHAVIRKTKTYAKQLKLILRYVSSKVNPSKKSLF